MLINDLIHCHRSLLTTHYSFFRFNVQENTTATLGVFDMAGRKIADLFEGDVNEGREYEVEFTPQNLKTGVYLTKLTIGSGKVYFKRFIINQ